MQEADRMRRAPHGNRIAARQIDGHLAVEVNAAIGCMRDAQFNLRLIADDDRAVGQRAGQSGTRPMPDTCGCRIGPLADMA